MLDKEASLPVAMPRQSEERAPEQEASGLVPAPESHPIGAVDDWYRDAIFYELHVRAFRDASGDGMGDFRGLIGKLDYLAELGVTALWLLPFYPSPLRDDGYDISDYRTIHPSYGTMRDFRRFLKEAHRRELRVITELVLNHTSDEHPWFQRARRARPGTIERDFYLWSDTPERFSDARVIFKDFESSNWTFDPAAHAYYWHRFYSHQPSLNYDNPYVRKAILGVVDFWLGLGVDGLRLDAVPYLYAREGTTCENLPEVFEFIRELRAHVEERFPSRVLIAEANQWPEDAVAYMGNGDMCQIAFHFPLMPRMFMAARQEDRYPIVDILNETPSPPPNCQWALFLRNHDELTLEMVTDEERDYMYRAYARDPQARVNVGIRRRLAPLLGGDRTMIEMMNGLLFSLPGTPIVYYGDEIGMGDNIYLGDRNAVRTPMQWDSDRNAGFSDANPQRLYLPVIIDPEYHSQAINVQAQEQNPNSLLWWMKRIMSLRKRYRAFGRGSLQLLRPENRKVLAFLRHYEDEDILVVVNLSRFAQCVELDLSEFRGATPVELFGNMAFPPVGDLPYFITLGSHGFYWFALERHESDGERPRPVFSVGNDWGDLFKNTKGRKFEKFLASYICDRRWFLNKARRIADVSIIDSVPITYEQRRESVPGRRAMSCVARLLIVRVEFAHGSPEQYALPVGYAQGRQSEDIRRWRPESVIAEVRVGDQQEVGMIFDAVIEPGVAWSMLDLMSRRRTVRGKSGRLVGLAAPPLRELRQRITSDVVPVPSSVEQSHSSVVFGDQAILKFARHLDEGTSPAVEVGRFLHERAGFKHSPIVGGSVEYRPSATGADPITIASMEEFTHNEGDGFSYVVDGLTHGLEEALAISGIEPEPTPPPDLVQLAGQPLPEGHPLVGPHLDWSSELGRRTAELHLALTSETDDRDFAPEPLTGVDRQSLYHAARNLVRSTFRQVGAAKFDSEMVKAVLARESEITDRLHAMPAQRVRGQRIRCHGDYHLGQVLWTGKTFVITDFEGEPGRSVGARRMKRPALVDVAAMIRSFHYAARAAAIRLTRELAASLDRSVLESWLTLWFRCISASFLRAYRQLADAGGFLPSEDVQLATMLDFFLLEKAVYELGYEANSRPEWVDIPAQGILDILATVA